MNSNDEDEIKDDIPLQCDWTNEIAVDFTVVKLDRRCDDTLFTKTEKSISTSRPYEIFASPI
jgi:hypothetical protein